MYRISILVFFACLLGASSVALARGSQSIAEGGHGRTPPHHVGHNGPRPQKPILRAIERAHRHQHSQHSHSHSHGRHHHG